MLRSTVSVADPEFLSNALAFLNRCPHGKVEMVSFAYLLQGSFETQKAATRLTEPYQASLRIMKDIAVLLCVENHTCAVYAHLCTHLLARPSQNCGEAGNMVTRLLILRLDSTKPTSCKAAKMGHERKKSLYARLHLLVLLRGREMDLALNN